MEVIKFKRELEDDFKNQSTYQLFKDIDLWIGCSDDFGDIKIVFTTKPVYDEDFHVHDTSGTGTYFIKGYVDLSRTNAFYVMTYHNFDKYSMDEQKQIHSVIESVLARLNSMVVK